MTLPLPINFTLKIFIMLLFLVLLTCLLSYLRGKRFHLSVHLALNLKANLFYYPVYFTIQLIFTTIYEFHCTFLYYSWVSLYYFTVDRIDNSWYYLRPMIELIMKLSYINLKIRKLVK